MAIANKLNFPLHGDRKLANKVQYAGDPDPVMVFVGGKPRFYFWSPDSVSSLVQWLEGDVSGPWMLDSANTGDDRILNNGPGLQRGRGVSVNGHTQHLEVSDDAAFDFSGTNAFSLTVLMNSTSSSGWDYILSKRGSNGGFFLALHHSEVKFGFGDGSSNYTVATGHTFVHGADTVLTLTYDGDKGRLYIDGALVFTSASLGAATLAANTEDLYIGQDNFGGGFLTALVAGIHIHNTDVGQSGASWLAFQGGSKPTGLVGRWLLDEQSGSTHYDSSGNGNNATAYNSPTHSTQNLKSWQNDEGYKGAMWFDGASDRSHTEITMDGDFTLSGWFYSVGAWGMLWSKLSSGNNYIWPLSTATLRCQFNGTFVDINHGHTFTTDEWVHLTVRRSGSTITVFKNGIAGGTTGTNSATWYMDGFGSYNNGSIYFNGAAYDQRAYSRALSDPEILAAATSSTAVTGSEIYTLPGSQGTDTSGNNDNTLNGVSEHLIPKVSGADEDVLGNTLDFTGPAPLHSQLASPSGTFDGVDDYGDVSHHENLDYSEGGTIKISGRVYAADFSTGSLQTLCYKDRQYNPRISATGEFQFAIPSVSGGPASGVYFTDGEWNDWSVEYDTVADTVTFTVGISTATVAMSDSPDDATNADLLVGGNPNSVLDGQLCELKIEIDSDTKAHWVWTEDSGTTVHDVSGNGHHMTLTNVTVLDYWANTQAVFAYGCANGYRLDSSVKIPGRADGLAADGSALTHPASAFNGASKLDHDPYTVPKLDSGNLDGVTPPSAHALGDSVVDAAQHFIRQTATKEDRFLLFSEDLVEPNLSKANSYTA